MEELLSAINDTPVPTILVVAGLAFILLAFAGRFMGRVEVRPERQRWVGITGAVVLLVGISLSMAPLVRPLGTSGGGGGNAVAHYTDTYTHSYSSSNQYPLTNCCAA